MFCISDIICEGSLALVSICTLATKTLRRCLKTHIPQTPHALMYVVIPIRLEIRESTILACALVKLRF
jgi:hypothetical protein